MPTTKRNWTQWSRRLQGQTPCSARKLVGRRREAVHPSCIFLFLPLLVYLASRRVDACFSYCLFFPLNAVSTLPTIMPLLCLAANFIPMASRHITSISAFIHVSHFFFTVYCCSDMYIYRVDKKSWQHITFPDAPLPRSSHQCVAAKIGGQNLMFLFGGEFATPNGDKFRHFKDFWVCDLDVCFNLI